MFTKLTTPQRIQVGLILAMAFLLVLGSNRLDKRNFLSIQTTVNSVHKDRVVVQDIIYQINNIFHAKELRTVLNEQDENKSGIENKKVNDLLASFSLTELTSKESSLLNELTSEFLNLQALEQKMTSRTAEVMKKNKASTLKILNEIEHKLDGLAAIQLEESDQLTQLSKKSLGMNILLSNIEVAFLIIIGLAMLALFFYPTNNLDGVQE